MPRVYGDDADLIEERAQNLGRRPTVLNVGSGSGVVDGWINIDRRHVQGVSVLADLNQIPWPFKNDSFEVVLCNHVLEHLTDIVHAMEEIHRISVHGGCIVIRTPYFANYESFRDPTHRWHFTWESFDYFVAESGFFVYTNRKFRLVGKRLTFAHWWRHPGYYLFSLSQRTYEKYFSHLFPGTWLHVLLEVDKRP